MKTIQTDTRDAVSALWNNQPAGVVEEASLSDAAGGLWQRLAMFRAALTSLIENISTDTQQQAKSATELL
ncbi:MAG: hypothetical protein IPO00_16520 [Betaproteobacteria bacterium]|nr:hypothetical protein [Betaproteobacteria bacterium]